eukprot:Gregarina_sp_Poly_1__9394@NODE_587_length_7368_cov_122_746473_g453_i0_p5_GENE_NODE_587_length_7368_cov_122_746473_g453_i0NODE_587_length_7368_cov_122_746473_g453_i0_p5_ORF_typecomplete_len129_score0_32Rhamno_transf/PF11316_8/0_21_NODE_587_length_7368_cov_122_746473_g453_i061856571
MRIRMSLTVGEGASGRYQTARASSSGYTQFYRILAHGVMLVFRQMWHLLRCLLCRMKKRLVRQLCMLRSSRKQMWLRWINHWNLKSHETQRLLDIIFGPKICSGCNSEQPCLSTILPARLACLPDCAC